MPEVCLCGMWGKTQPSQSPRCWSAPPVLWYGDCGWAPCFIHTTLAMSPPSVSLGPPASFLWNPQIPGPEHLLGMENEGELFLFTATAIFSPLYCSLALFSLWTILLLPREVLSSQRLMNSLPLRNIPVWSIFHHNPGRAAWSWQSLVTPSCYACLWTLHASLYSINTILQSFLTFPCYYIYTWKLILLQLLILHLQQLC